MGTPHAITRRFYAEDLVRLRRAGEQRRYIASQRAGRVDPNPHQIDAVIFALHRLAEGGCILADEVGLGKTIEAGLVMAQLRAEGAQRILLITPKPLLGQWREELWTLFGIESREVTRDAGPLGPGVFLVGREFAGSEPGSAMLIESGRFDLAIIDEAHEIFAGIYRRYDRRGGIAAQSRYAKTAARVKQVLTGTPVLLLTATPIQNTLTELWGLVQYIEPTGTLLGDLPTFRTVFCDGDDRRLRPGQGEELRRRIASVCQRTLRRQAQEFMQQKFVRRSARLFTYAMTRSEQALYDDVTAFLMEPDLCAFGGGHRRLLLLSFHRRMASSTRALADSLDAVHARLERRLTGKDTQTLAMFRADLEDEDAQDEAPPDADATPTDRLQDEIRRVARLAQRARALGVDSKAAQLVAAVRMVLERAQEGLSRAKIVIFTEAISTQDYLVEVLTREGVVGLQEITVFRGTNVGPRVDQAEAAWAAEIGAKIPPSSRPSATVARRMALVHEFATATKIFIATEAGAKGLNLQFCEHVINYDLPWNPQRIEQRIGRCHRYGQTRDVTVINFIAADNAAEQHTFEILSRKLELFGTVLDASDVVLHESRQGSPGHLLGAIGGDLEAQLQDLYANASSATGLADGLARLSERLGAERSAFEDNHARTAGLIETRFDETVRTAFRRLHEEVPTELAQLDRDLEGVLLRYLDASGRGHRIERGHAHTVVDIDAAPLETEASDAARVVVGDATAAPQADLLHLGHRLIRAALDEARRATRGRFFVQIRLRDLPPAPAAQLRAGAGRFVLLRVSYGGYESAVELIVVSVCDGQAEPLPPEVGAALVVAPMLDVAEISPQDADDARMGDAIDEAIFVAQGDVDHREQVRLEAAIDRIERHMDDKISVLLRWRAELSERLTEARRRRDTATGASARTEAERECAEIQVEIDARDVEIDRLRRRDDPDYVMWCSRAHERRYTPPRWETLVDAEFELI